jgi:hypothetical protein
LKRISAGGGLSSVVHDGIRPGGWELTERGIVFVMQDDVRPAGSGARDVVAVLDTATMRVRKVGELPFPLAPFGTRRFLIASRDGRWAIASHIDRWDRDVMVLDNVGGPWR